MIIVFRRSVTLLLNFLQIKSSLGTMKTFELLCLAVTSVIYCFLFMGKKYKITSRSGLIFELIFRWFDPCFGQLEQKGSKNETFTKQLQRSIWQYYKSFLWVACASCIESKRVYNAPYIWQCIKDNFPLRIVFRLTSCCLIVHNKQRLRQCSGPLIKSEVLMTMLRID